MRREKLFPYGVLALAALFILLVTGYQFGSLPYTPSATFSDAVVSHLPAAEYLHDAPVGFVWRDTILGGHPFAANPLNKTAYPFQWLTLLFPSSSLFLGMMIYFHLFLAGAGMMIFARNGGAGIQGAWLSGVAYMVAPRVMAHTGAGHLDILYACAWIPFFFNALRLLLDEPFQKSRILLVGLFAGLIVASDVRLAFLALLAGVIYAVYISRFHWRRLLHGFPAVILALFLSSAVIVPLVLWSPYLSRAGLTPQEAGLFSLELPNLLGVLLPVTQNNVELNVALGLIPLFLATFAILTQPRFRWVSVAVLLTVWYALGLNGLLWNVLTTVFPPLLWFRVPSRAWFIVTFIIAYLAAFGFQSLTDPQQNLRLRFQRKFPLVVFGLALLFGLLGVFCLLMLDINKLNGVLLLVVSVALMLCFIAVQNKSVRRSLQWMIPILVLVELIGVGRSWLEWRGESYWLTPYVPLANFLLEQHPERIYSPAYSVPQNVAETYDLNLFYGVDPFQVAEVAEAIQRAGGLEPSHAYSVVQPPLNDVVGEDLSTANQSAVPDLELLADWGVTHIIAPYPYPSLEAAGRFELLSEIDGVYVYENLFVRPDCGSACPESIWGTEVDLALNPSSVHRLNDFTLFAHILSGMSYLILAFILIVKKVRLW